MKQKKIRNFVLSFAAGACALSAQTGTLTNTYTLPDTPIGEFQNKVFPGSIPDDHGFLLGSIGSGLFRSFLEGNNVYWMVTDRGPNPLVTGLRTFPLEGFTPWLLKVRTTGTSIEILQKVPLTLPSGAPATGLPNTSPRDEAVRVMKINPTTGLCEVTTSAQNLNGLDTEDLVRTLDGNFWLVDEHSPSIVKVSPNGQVAKRYLPFNLNLTGIGYPVANNLPEIYGAKRKQNRGFEGIALGWDLRTLYAALQSPMRNPDNPAGDGSRNTRILTMDAYNEQVKAEYVYRFDLASTFGGPTPPLPADMKISAMVAALDPWRFLVLERTDFVAKVYRVDIRQATNILNTKWDLVATTPSLEKLEDAELLAENVKVLPKELIIDLSKVPGMDAVQKIEGMTIIDFNTIAFSNDNDFAVGPATCDKNVGTGVKNSIYTVRLNKSLLF